MAVPKEWAPVKRGRVVIGHFAPTADGGTIYVARRKRAHIFRSRRPSISTAIMEEVAGWAIDEQTLFNARSRRCAFLAVLEADTGDLWVTRLAAFFDPAWSRAHDYEGVGRGSRQRMLPLQHFLHKKGDIRARKGVLEGVASESLLTFDASLLEGVPA